MTMQVPEDINVPASLGHHVNLDKLKIIGPQALVRRLRPEERSASGLLIIPESARGNSVECVVVKVGYQRIDPQPAEEAEDFEPRAGYYRPLDVKPGQHVLVCEHNGHNLSLNGDTSFLVVHDDYIEGWREGSEDTWKPYGNRVLIERTKGRSQIGSIIIPDEYIEKPAEGIIRGVGPGRVREDSGERDTWVRYVSEGEKVLFGKYTGEELKKLPGMLFMHADEVQAVREETVS